MTDYMPVDVFAGVADSVPAELADHLRVLRLVDHHVHGVFTRPVDRPAFEASICEASTGAVPSHMTMFDSPLGVAIRAWCAPLLGLPRHAPAGDYWEARGSHEPLELARMMLGAAGVDRWVVDTGYQELPTSAPETLGRLSGAAVSEVLRLEALTESLRTERVAAADFPAEFRARLAAARPGIAGVKTIAAYRCGFDIDWSPPSDAAVSAAFAASPARVASPALIAFGVHAAATLDLPIQVHVGFGDRDLDLHRSDPMLLLPLLRTMPPAPVTLLHCYPFHRQAGYLSQAFDHVHFDVGLGLNYLGARSVELVGEALELAPFAKQLYSSDAFGPPELHFLGSLLWRRAAGIVLGSWVRRGDWSVDDAIRAVDLISARNAARVYGVPLNTHHPGA